MPNRIAGYYRPLETQAERYRVETPYRNPRNQWAASWVEVERMIHALIEDGVKPGDIYVFHVTERPMRLEVESG